MRIPKFRVGDYCRIPGRLFDFVDQADLLKGRILFPVEGGKYFVRIEATGGYIIVSEKDIIPDGEAGIQPLTDTSRIRVVFFGNGKFALPTLKYLVATGFDIAAVVTTEDRPQGRSKAPKQCAVKEYAASIGLHVYQPRKLDSQRFIKHIRSLYPTVGVVVEYRKLPPQLFNIPAWGTVNLHSSLLPMYRGASTIISAIKDRQPFAGVTTFLLDKTIDTGAIINNYGICIGDDDCAGDIFAKLRNIGAQMVFDAISRLQQSCTPVPQEEIVCDFLQPSRAPKVFRKDCIIPWLKTADTVYNFIRAYSPVPTAWTTVKMLTLAKPLDMKVFKTSKTDISRGHHAPGELFWHSRRLMVACGDELLSIEELQLPGRNRMTAIEFYNGFRGACKGFCELPYSVPKGYTAKKE